MGVMGALSVLLTFLAPSLFLNLRLSEHSRELLH